MSVLNFSLEHSVPCLWVGCHRVGKFLTSTALLFHIIGIDGHWSTSTAALLLFLETLAWDTEKKFWGGCLTGQLWKLPYHSIWWWGRESVRLGRARVARANRRWRGRRMTHFYQFFKLRSQNTIRCTRPLHNDMRACAKSRIVHRFKWKMYSTIVQGVAHSTSQVFSHFGIFVVLKLSQSSIFLLFL